MTRDMMLALIDKVKKVREALNTLDVGTLADDVSNLETALNELEGTVGTLTTAITNIVSSGDITLNENWGGTISRLLMYTEVKDASGHGILVVSGLADNLEALTADTAYEVGTLPHLALRDVVVYTANGKWSVAFNTNVLKFTPSANMAIGVGDIVSIPIII